MPGLGVQKPPHVLRRWQSRNDPECLTREALTNYTCHLPCARFLSHFHPGKHCTLSSLSTYRCRPLLHRPRRPSWATLQGHLLASMWPLG